MKEEVVKALLHKHNYNYNSHATIYATIKPSVGTINNGIGKLLHANKTHILHFNSQGIVILPLNEMSGAIEEKLIQLIPEDIILKKELQMKFLFLHLILKTKKGDIVYKIRRSALGSPWHKENLSFMLLNASSRSLNDEI